MVKTGLPSISAKNRVYEALIERLQAGHGFLVSGHHDPDADCVATMLGFALLARKLRKPVTMIVGGSIPENLGYIVKIAEYNRIGINETPVSSTDTLVICDTAKSSLLPADPVLRHALDNPDMTVFEIDHHLGGDSEYIAPLAHALVDRASSSGSLLARLVWKIDRRGIIEDTYSRNLVIALLTAMMSDTQMGKILPTHAEARLYVRLIDWLSCLLARSTFSPNNFDTVEALYAEMVRLSDAEQRLDNVFMEHGQSDGALAWVALDEKHSARLIKEYGDDSLKAAARRVTDRMTGISGKLGLVCYYDSGELIQCRMRREFGYEGVDLREVINRSNAPDGGGHPGAVGFRFPKSSVPDYDVLVQNLVEVAQVLTEG